MHEVLPHNCEPIQVLEKDPVPIARKATYDARRLHPNIDILPEVISAAIDLSCAADTIAQALTINAAHRIAGAKERELMTGQLV